MMDMTACLRRACLALASTALVVGLTGCTGSNEPDPLPPVDTASPAVGSPSETARPDEVGPGTEAWRQRLEPDESAAYDNALIRWSEYTRRAEDVYARGKNTARARQFFRDMDLRWRERIRVLEGIERAG